MSHKAVHPFPATAWETISEGTSATGSTRDLPATPVHTRWWQPTLWWWSAVWPLTAICVIVWASGPGLGAFVGKYALTGKDFQEVLGPSVLLGAICVGLSLMHSLHSRYLLWLTALATLLWCREMHFPGTGLGVYLGLVLWGIWGWRDLNVRRIWQTPALCSLCLLGTLGWYAIAKSVDDGCWKWLPYSGWWSVNVEETLETGGHFSMLLTVFSSVLLRRQR